MIITLLRLSHSDRYCQSVERKVLKKENLWSQIAPKALIVGNSRCPQRYGASTGLGLRELSVLATPTGTRLSQSSTLLPSSVRFLLGVEMMFHNTERNILVTNLALLQTSIPCTSSVRGMMNSTLNH